MRQEVGQYDYQGVGDMYSFISTQIKLGKSVKKGDMESLLSLFSSEDRLKRMEILKDLDEGDVVKVILEGLGQVDLKLGNYMEKGDQKTIMTLFWLPEKSRLFEMQRDAKAGEIIVMNMMTI
jgi:hypothetical protein